jgi:hypothetical protein
MTMRRQRQLGGAVKKRRYMQDDNPEVHDEERRYRMTIRR